MKTRQIQQLILLEFFLFLVFCLPSSSSLSSSFAVATLAKIFPGKLNGFPSRMKAPNKFFLAYWNLDFFADFCECQIILLYVILFYLEVYLIMAKWKKCRKASGFMISFCKIITNYIS